FISISFMSRSFGNKGFTLAELLVSIAIMLLITTTILFNQKSYDDTTQIKNAAETLSLDIRQAQVYGLSVRETAVGTSDFSAGYGITTTKQALTDTTKNYTLFIDRNPKNGYFDDLGPCNPTPTTECVSQTNLPQSVAVTQVCIVRLVGQEDCTSS